MKPLPHQYEVRLSVPEVGKRFHRFHRFHGDQNYTVHPFRNRS